MAQSLFSRRFIELAEAAEKLPHHTNHSGTGTHVKEADWRRWATSAQSLIRAVYGEGTPHYQNFVKACDNCSGQDFNVRTLRGVFLSAKDDFDGGYVFNVDLKVSGEVLGDFVALARHSLNEGNKNVAAVLACAALEDALKRFAATNGIDVNQKTMQDVVNALKSKGLVSGAQKSILDTLPRVRNLALHADWDKLSEPDVGSVIGFVESFLLTRFSDA